MARLAYSAPGVYSELMPALRRPIFGVGTNTVGFIGLVPNRIWIPVPNPDYDPVLTRELAEMQRMLAEGATSKEIADMKKSLEARQGELQAQFDARTREQADADDEAKKKIGAFTDAEKAQRDAGPTAANAAELKTEVSKARTASKLAQQALVDANKALDDARKGLDEVIAQATKAMATPAEGGAEATAAPGAVALATPGVAAPAAAKPFKPATENEDYAYADVEPPDEFKRRSPLRPYYFEERQIKVDPLSTKLCTNFSEYAALFGDFSGFKNKPENPEDPPEYWRYAPLSPGHHMLTHAVNGFFLNGGTRCFVARISRADELKKVLERFESIDEVAILAAPGLPKMPSVWEDLQSYCENDAHQNVFAILDPTSVVNDGKTNELEIQQLQYEGGGADSALPRKCPNAAFYFPFIEVSCPAKRLQDADPARRVPARYAGLTYVPPSGHMAGVYARTDEERGVHKAPANVVVRGALEVKYYVSKPKQELLNPQGVNCIRLLNGAVTVWGGRTIGGAKNGDLMYINVSRFLGFLQESIDEGTQWVVFEPNDPNLWSRIVLDLTSFLTNVWRSGALFGLTQQEAFYVRCDAELNPPSVRDLGQVITEIGVAIVRPAEFVIFRITQFSAERNG